MEIILMFGYYYYYFLICECFHEEKHVLNYLHCILLRDWTMRRLR